ncbi:hypothetical protein [Streptomyces sp. NPDC087787]|uniref:hypothetical protein n=1 Tax=Streptomyces sp. NPDC087787 TaxID=3365803 RepID=UPI003803FCA8
MDLAQALDAALRDRYRVAEVKSPVTSQRGLQARMNQIEKALETPAAAARAAGVSRGTWRRWRNGKQAPSAASLRQIEHAHVNLVILPAFRADLKRRPTPKSVTVTATIKWSKSTGPQYNKTAHRTTTLTGMQKVMKRVIRAWAMAGPEAAAEILQRGASDVYQVEDDGDRPGIEFEGDRVEIDLS